jgi:hypothetical protein
VLQAVTEVPFLIDDQMCTRFATEIVLRRSGPNDSTTVEISIIPDPDESPDKKESLLAWHPKEFDPKANLNKLTVKAIFEQVRIPLRLGSA